MIEDIEYLNENCEKDSVTFYVDSSMRNREFYPYASEFVMNFSQPFRLVNGFDILDAAIPTTMYNIDNTSVSAAFSIVSRSALSSVDRRAQFVELSTSHVFSNIFESMLDSTFVAVCNESVLSSFDITKRVSVNSRILTPYYVAIRRVISNTVMIRDKYGINEDMFFIKYKEDGIYGIPKTDSRIAIFNDNNYFLNKKDDNTFDLIYFEFYEVSEEVYFAVTQSISYIILVSNYTRSIEEGNYDISTLRNDMNALWNDLTIFVETTTTMEKKQGKLRIFSNNLCIFNARKSGMRKCLGFDTQPLTSEGALYEAVTVGENRDVFMGNYNAADNQYIILAPGLVNLLGERFVILRCKEIEDHLLGSFAYMSYVPGIGMFKLASSYNDVTNLRFDFVNLVRKPFHPIGKLQRLTFRFELSNGKPYDFKGVNVQMLMMVKFLVPTQKFKFERSILNPNYDANFMKYMANAKSIQYKEDSEQEEEFDTDKYYQMYKKELDRYDYSSSEGEEGYCEDDDDSEVDVELSHRRGDRNL